MFVDLLITINFFYFSLFSGWLGGLRLRLLHTTFAYRISHSVVEVCLNEIARLDLLLVELL